MGREVADDKGQTTNDSWGSGLDAICWWAIDLRTGLIGKGAGLLRHTECAHYFLGSSMKAERRHELKHNELADWLGATMEQAKPHAGGVLLGLGVLVAVVLGTMWYFSGETASSSRAWSNYFEAFNEREPQKVLQNLATEQSGTKAAWWALAAVADMNLAEGAALLHSDRTEAQKRLEIARDAYLKVEASAEPLLKTRARLGLGKLYESLCDPAKALEYYEKVAASEKDSAIGKVAAADAKRMKDPREKEFLAWFANQTPKRPTPLPGVGGNLPGMPSELSDRPDFGMPKLGVDTFGVGKAAEGEKFPAAGVTTPPVATDPADAAKGVDARQPETNAPAPEGKAEPAKTPEPDASAKKQPE
jgi:hypothetical protein